MKRTRHTPEQVIRKLRDADRMLAEQKSVAEVAKELGVSENTYHRWRNRYQSGKRRRTAEHGHRNPGRAARCLIA